MAAIKEHAVFIHVDLLGQEDNAADLDPETKWPTIQVWPTKPTLLEILFRRLFNLKRRWRLNGKIAVTAKSQANNAPEVNVQMNKNQLSIQLLNRFASFLDRYIFEIMVVKK